MFNDILTSLEGTKVLATYSTSYYTGILEPFAAYITAPERVEVVLRRKGERKYFSDSDCGIILPLYREHGLGMFAMPDADAPLGFPLSLISEDPGGRASAGRHVGAMVGNIATMAACSLMLVLPISPDGTGIALYVSASRSTAWAPAAVTKDYAQIKYGGLIFNSQSYIISKIQFAFEPQYLRINL